jgi:translation initiation factor IF-2
LKALIANGIMAKITEEIDFDTAAIVAEDLGVTLEPVGSAAARAAAAKAPAPAPTPAARATAAAAPVEVEAAPAEAIEVGPVEPGIPWYIADEAEGDLIERPPIVTVMGHVDHGKTTLLDALRDTRVAAGESGGITQHIGAYSLHRNGGSITFIDTPGHEAFTAMRARGAQTTDIAVIVVAADDGVMPQTREALDHARAAGVPIIVAVNKIDIEGSRPERVLEQMAELNLVPDSWGGDTFFIPISAAKGDGLDELLDAILLVAEDRKPLANPASAARGTILEGRVEQGRGVVVSVIVQTGTLRRGDTIVTGNIFGRARALFDQGGAQIAEAGPATPVEIMGLPEVPPAGARFEVVRDDKVAKARVAERDLEDRSVVAPTAAPALTLDELFAQATAGAVKALNLVVKTDVQGTVEPIVASLQKLAGPIRVEVLHAAAGDITESDVNLAAASGAVVIGFRVSPDAAAKRAVERQGIEIREYEVIYKMVEDIQDALTGMLEPEYADTETGRAEVRAVFTVPRAGSVAGCYVSDGVVRRNATVHVMRGDQEVATTTVSSLKRFTEDVREVRSGFECGIGLANFNDNKVGDVLVFTVRERVR